MIEFTFGAVSRARHIETKGDYDAVLIVQRSNPVTLAHVENVRTGSRFGARVISAKGSAYHPRTAKNPFSDEEVELMWKGVLQSEPAVLEKMRFVRIRDYYDNEKWARKVVEEVYSVLEADGVPRAKARVAILGHSKDESSFYLKMFPDFDQIEVPNFKGLNATDVRNLFYDANNLAGHWPLISTMVPAATLDMLKSLAMLPTYDILVREHRYIQNILSDEDKFRELKGKKDWELNTNAADAIIRCQNKVLMGYRSGAYGYGQLAFPGGIKGRETFLDAALRELFEETTLEFTKDYFVQNFLRDQHIFDNPGRSAAGVRVSVGFYFDMGNLPIPEVWGKDDMGGKKMVWIDIDDFHRYESQMFEDHACGWDRFFHIWK